MNMRLWHKTFYNNKPPLVLLHGWGFNADIFSSIIQTLSKDYELTLIDLPGHGRSEVVKGGLIQWTDALMPLIPKDATLAGWSLGGLLAIQLSKKCLPKRLILLASNPCFVQKKGWQYGIDADNFVQFSNTLNSSLNTGLKNFVRLQSLNKTQLVLVNQAIKTYPANPIALNQGLDILLQTDLRQLLLTRKLPVEAILGKKDALVNAKIKAWYESNNIKTTLLNGGHLPFLQPEFLL